MTTKPVHTGVTGVERADHATRFKPGNKLGTNGLNAEEREARDAVRKALSGDLRQVGLDAYKRLLEADNAPVVLDFMHRLAGKPTERVLHGEDPENPFDTTPALTQDERRALLKVQLAAESKK
jgi:hypothetical protein